jgi:hypothetical protein
MPPRGFPAIPPGVAPGILNGEALYLGLISLGIDRSLLVKDLQIGKSSFDLEEGWRLGANGITRIRRHVATPVDNSVRIMSK